jgi:hypothetical protein
MKNHNRGPIGPLDPDEPPPYDPSLRPDDNISIWEVVKALQSMGVPIEEIWTI